MEGHEVRSGRGQWAIMRRHVQGFLSFWEFAKIHGPNTPFVEGLMKARDDLDRTAVNEIMESVKRKVKDENLTDRKCSWRVHIQA